MLAYRLIQTTLATIPKTTRKPCRQESALLYR
jgi:hypothetical protein